MKLVTLVLLSALCALSFSIDIDLDLIEKVLEDSKTQLDQATLEKTLRGFQTRLIPGHNRRGVSKSSEIITICYPLNPVLTSNGFNCSSLKNYVLIAKEYQEIKIILFISYVSPFFFFLYIETRFIEQKFIVSTLS